MEASCRPPLENVFAFPPSLLVVFVRFHCHLAIFVRFHCRLARFISVRMSRVRTLKVRVCFGYLTGRTPPSCCRPRTSSPALFLKRQRKASSECHQLKASVRAPGAVRLYGREEFARAVPCKLPGCRHFSSVGTWSGRRDKGGLFH